MAKDASSFLDENTFDTHPSFFTKESKVGDAIEGRIVEAPRIVTVPDLNTKEPTEKLVLAIEHSDGEVYSVWVQKALASAVGKAVKEATGGTSIEEGATIRVEFSGLGTASQPGYNPPKQWTAKYAAPKASVDAGSLFDQD